MMARLFLAAFLFAVVAAAAGPLWAEDTGSDREIALSIVEALREKQQMSELRDFNIGIRVDDGVVWVEGKVSKPKQLKMVLKLAQRTPGVQRVVNEVQVVAPKESQQLAGKPQPPVVPASAGVFAPRVPAPGTKMPPPVVPAYANFPVAADGELRWLSEAKQTADEIVKSIESKKKAGELTGFDLIVKSHVGKSIFLCGKVANEQTRDTLLSIARNQAEDSSVHDSMRIAEEGTNLSNKVTSHVSKIYPHRNATLDWNDGWWMLDFKSKKSR
jgi:osmotically-inducible protein OsmY